MGLSCKFSLKPIHWSLIPKIGAKNMGPSTRTEGGNFSAAPNEAGKHGYMAGIESNGEMVRSWMGKLMVFSHGFFLGVSNFQTQMTTEIVMVWLSDACEEWLQDTPSSLMTRGYTALHKWVIITIHEVWIPFLANQ
jgi:hypothetical protein